MKIYFFGEDRVPIEFLPHLSNLETHLRPEPYYDLITFKAHITTRGVLFKVMSYPWSYMTFQILEDKNLIETLSPTQKKTYFNFWLIGLRKI